MTHNVSRSSSQNMLSNSWKTYLTMVLGLMQFLTGNESALPLLGALLIWFLRSSTLMQIPTSLRPTLWQTRRRSISAMG